MLAQRTRRVLLFGCATASVAFATLGCESPQNRANQPKSMWPSDDKSGDKNAIDPTRIAERDDIVRVVQFWPQTPWLFDSERVIGFKATIYFIAGESMKGAFVPRNILVWINEVLPGPRGQDERKLVHMWEFDSAEAMGYRVNRRSVLGYYYGFPLRWPEELELEGKLIELQFGYERADTRVVLSSPKRLRVPVPQGFQPAAARAEE